jgi:hypothetical protein
MSETRKDGKMMLNGVKDAYLEMVDETANLVKQPIVASKQIAEMAFEGEEQIVKGMAENKSLAPFKDTIEMNARLLESLTKQATLGVKMGQMSVDVFTNAVLMWGRLGLEAQKSYVQSFQNWLNTFRI